MKFVTEILPFYEGVNNYQYLLVIDLVIAFNRQERLVE